MWRPTAALLRVAPDPNHSSLDCGDGSECLVPRTRQRPRTAAASCSGGAVQFRRSGHSQPTCGRADRGPDLDGFAAARHDSSQLSLAASRRAAAVHTTAPTRDTPHDHSAMALYQNQCYIAVLSLVMISGAPRDRALVAPHAPGRRACTARAQRYRRRNPLGIPSRNVRLHPTVAERLWYSTVLPGIQVFILC